MREKNVKHRPKYLLAVIFVTVLVMVMGLSTVALAAEDDTVTVEVSGIYGQSEARTMLERINDFRTGRYVDGGKSDPWAYDQNGNVDTESYKGLGELQYDYDLEQAAMQRAMEVALQFSHTRPTYANGSNNSSCYEVFPEGYSAMGENIATGYGGSPSTALQAFDQWAELDNGFSGQGHRRNMLGRNFNRIGIAFVKIHFSGSLTEGTRPYDFETDIYYWVQSLGRKDGTDGLTPTEPANESMTKQVEVLKSNIERASMKITKENLNLENGQTYDFNDAESQIRLEGTWPTRFAMTWKDGSGNPVGTSEGTYVTTVQGGYTLSSSDSSIASVDGRKVTGNKVGSTTLTATSAFDSNVGGIVNVNVTAKSITGALVVPTQSSYIYSASAIEPDVTVVKDGETLVENEDYEISYSNNTNAGTGQITVTGKGKYKDTATGQFTIQPRSVTSEDITVSQIGSITYNGTEQTPLPTVEQGTKTLVKGTDYELFYSNNINAGDNATVTITGKGNYKDSVDKTFTITKKALSDEMVALSKTEFAYNGQNQKPDVTVSDGSAMTAQDYSVINNGGTNAGEYEVTVNATANGNYSGSITKKFTIAPKALTADMISITSDSAVYDGTDQTPAFKVMDGETELVKDTDYEVENDGKGKAAGNYDIKIKGKGNYSGSVTKAFTISKKPLTDTMVTLKNTEFTYNGQNQKPTVTVEDGELMTADDYQITNNGGTNAGDHKVTVSAKDNGNYSGSVEKSFKINPKAIADESVTVTVAGGSTYNGSEQEPDVTVKDGDNSLTSNDFEVAYSDNITAGENAKATIKGKGNYTGSRTQTFSIAPASLTGATIVLKPIGNESIEMGDTTVYVQETEGTAITPAIDSVTVGDTKLGTDDYDVAYSKNTAPGKDAKVTITGKGNYKDTAEVTFIIVSKEEFEIEEKINKLNGELDALKQAAETAKGNYADAEEKAKASKAAADSASATPGQAAVNAAQKAADDAAVAEEAAKAVEIALADLQEKINEIQQAITDAKGKVVVLKNKIEQYAGEIQGLSETTAGEIATAKQNAEKAEQAKSAASSALEKAKSDKAEADKKAAEGTTPGQNGNTNLDDPKTGNTDKGAGEKAEADDDDDDEDAATIAKINAAKAAKVKIKGKALKKLKVQLTWKKVKNVSGFEVYQSAKKKGKFKKLATIKKGTAVKWLSKKIKKGKKGKKVFFKVRAFTIVDGDKVYGKWSNVKAIKLKK